MWRLATLLIMLLGTAVAEPLSDRPDAGLSPQQRERVELTAFLRETLSTEHGFEDRFDAEVWLLAMSSRLAPFMANPAKRLYFLRALHREASAAGLRPDLVLALIEVESRFDQYAVSRAGARGLMQVMPFWMKEIGRPDDNLLNIDTNLRYGCRILQFYLKKERGKWDEALARYNGSYGKYWYPRRVAKAFRKRWRDGRDLFNQV